MSELTKEAAIEAARAAAFTVDDPDSSDHGRTLLHSFLGGIGADWDLVGVVALIEGADAVEWADSLFGHDLVVHGHYKGEVRVSAYCFDVKRPVSA